MIIPALSVFSCNQYHHFKEKYGNNMEDRIVLLAWHLNFIILVIRPSTIITIMDRTDLPEL